MATVRSSEGLRNTLFDTLDSFMAGQLDATQAKTIAKLSDSILKSAAIDLEHRRFIRELTRGGQPSEVADLNLNITLGSITVTPTDGRTDD